MVGMTRRNTPDTLPLTANKSEETPDPIRSLFAGDPATIAARFDALAMRLLATEAGALDAAQRLVLDAEKELGAARHDLPAAERAMLLESNHERLEQARLRLTRAEERHRAAQQAATEAAAALTMSRTDLAARALATMAQDATTAPIEATIPAAVEKILAGAREALAGVAIVAEAEKRRAALAGAMQNLAASACVSLASIPGLAGAVDHHGNFAPVYLENLQDRAVPDVWRHLRAEGLPVEEHAGWFNLTGWHQ